jgi:hypothetical protein
LLWGDRTPYPVLRREVMDQAMFVRISEKCVYDNETARQRNSYAEEV